MHPCNDNLKSSTVLLVAFGQARPPDATSKTSALQNESAGDDFLCLEKFKAEADKHKSI